MTKKILIRFLNGFCYSIAITMIIYAGIMFVSGAFPMHPGFTAHFDNELKAFVVQLFLIGIMSAVTSAGTVIFEAKKIGIPVQSSIYLVIMLASWIPVACFVWHFYEYMVSMVTTIGSIIVTYIVNWWIQYRHCKNEIAEINARLLERKA